MINKGKTMYCKYCGKTIDNDSLFCCYCGKNLTAIGKKQTIEEESDEEDTNENQESYIDTPPSWIYERIAKEKEQKESSIKDLPTVSIKKDEKKKGPIDYIVTVSIIIIIVIALIFAFSLIYAKIVGDETEKSPNTTTSSKIIENTTQSSNKTENNYRNVVQSDLDISTYEENYPNYVKYKIKANETIYDLKVILIEYTKYGTKFNEITFEIGTIYKGETKYITQDLSNYTTEECNSIESAIIKVTNGKVSSSYLVGNSPSQH